MLMRSDWLELDQLLATIDGNLAEHQVITGLPSLSGPATYRLATLDGRVFKGRKWTTAEQLEAFLRNCNEVSPKWMSSVVAASRQWTIEEWVEGEPLPAEHGNHRYLKKCGEYLAQLHSTKPSQCVSHELQTPESRRDRSIDELRTLQDRELLAPHIASRLEALLVKSCPKEFSPLTLIHRDVCPENLVLRDDGQLVMVDNTCLCVGVPEEDLARVWYRWPLEISTWRRFKQGYGQTEAITRFEQHFLFWYLLVLIRSAFYRSEVESSEVEEPLRMLHTLAGD